MTKLLRILLSLLFMGLLPQSAVAQDVEATLKKVKALKNAPKEALEAGVKVNGSIASTSTYFDSKLVQLGPIPFESNLSGAINFDFFGKVKMPFTFNLNTQSINFSNPFDRQFRVRQPFNIMQFRPTYKGLTLIVGSGAASFSPLTVNGHRYEGFGIDFKPASFPVYGKFMTGTLLKAVRPDSLLALSRPTFKRTGIGGQIGVKKESNEFEIILFRAQDKPDALVSNLDAFEVTPQQNAVAGFKAKTVIAKVIAVEVETAISGITEDTRSEITPENVSNTRQFFGLLNVNASTIYRNAIKTSLAYQGKTFNLGATYNRTDPEYRTLGSYFFTNDLENITANAASQFLSGKLSVMANLGRQRDNLDNAKTQSFSQWVGSSIISFVPSENFMLNLNYSNFTAFTNLRTDLEYLTAVVPYNALDTLNFRQINQNIQADISSTFPSSNEDVQQSITANALYQHADDIQGNNRGGSRVGNLNVNYSYNSKPKNLQLTSGINIARNDYLIIKDWLVGPTLNLGSSFFKKQLKAQATTTYLRTWGQTKETSGILNARLGANYTLLKKHSFGLNLTFMHRQVNEVRPIDKDFWQFIATLNYSYSFELLNLSKK